MKLTNLICALFFISFSFPRPFQAFTMNYGKERKNSFIQFDKLILELLNDLQQKLMDNTFGDEDMHMLYELSEFILKVKDYLNRRRERDETVYWLLRQGR